MPTQLPACCVALLVVHWGIALAAAEPAPEFFNGRDLTGWSAEAADMKYWSVQEGAIVGRATENIPHNSFLWSDVPAADFYFACDVRLKPNNGNAGIQNPFNDRGPRWITRLGTCPVRFTGEAGSIETGDSGDWVVQPDALQGELPKAQKTVSGLDVSAHARNFFDCIKSRQPTVCNSNVMRHSHIACHAAALSWILKRKLALDPAKEEFIGDAEANGLRTRPEREWNLG